MTIPISLLGRAKQLLRQGGLSGNVLWDILDQMARKMVLDFSRGSRLDVSGPLTECPLETAESHLKLLDQTEPSVASILRQHLDPVLSPSVAKEVQSAKLK
jgi:hypothetical protein